MLSLGLISSIILAPYSSSHTLLPSGPFSGLGFPFFPPFLLSPFSHLNRHPALSLLHLHLPSPSPSFTPTHQTFEPRMSKLFDIRHQLLQYATHHNHPVNVAIHLTCIPLILWTALVFAANTGPLLPYPSAEAVASGATFPVLVDKVFQFATPNLAWMVMLGYVGYYFALDKETAFISAPLFLGAAKHATYFLATTPNAIRIAAYIHAAAWIAQFIGHGVFEKRAPKLTENLVQALVLAPYFVVWELLFFVGYRPQLKRELDVLVDVDVKAFRARKAAMKAGAAAPGKADPAATVAAVGFVIDEKKEQ